MLPKQIKNQVGRTNPAEDFQARTSYVCDKATTIKLMNVTSTWKTAASQMAFTAGLNPRLRTPCCHVVCSWSETETHTDGDMICAMEMVLQEMGAADHQAVIGIHRNTLSGHAHGVFNRVHPITGVALSMSNSFAKLESACRNVEYRMGWPSDRGRYDINWDGDEIVLRPKPASHWERKKGERELGLRPESGAAREQNRRMGHGSLRDTMNPDRKERLKVALDFSSSWAVVHAALSRIGLAYQRYRSGARIVETATDRQMPASGLGAKYGMRRMCERLGAFVATKVPLSLAKSATSAEVGPNLRKLKRRQARERKAIRANLHGARSPEALAFRAILREDHAEEIRALKETLGRPRSRPSPRVAYPAPDRYSHAARQRLAGLPEPDDHTARRQNWMLASHDMAQGLPEILGKLVAQYPDTIRVNADGDLLFASRLIDGSIASFDRLSLQVIPPKMLPDTSPHGVCAIGPHPGGTCLLVRTPLDAINEMLQIDGPMPMVIVAGDTLNPGRKAHIEWLTKGRKIAIAAELFEETPEMLDRLQTMFPLARLGEHYPKRSFRMEEPQEGTGRDASRDDDAPFL
ncbi:relaxase/mobilization nuclease domain-containing protein [Roseovarius mucosus]|uniref:relaxase/mobilization nuclease domain-containing protein n=1 Tax=Roseovarius mucosus TaxID=215743 RepID=UPI0035D09B0C